MNIKVAAYTVSIKCINISLKTVTFYKPSLITTCLYVGGGGLSLAVASFFFSFYSSCLGTGSVCFQSLYFH